MCYTARETLRDLSSPQGQFNMSLRQSGWQWAGSLTPLLQQSGGVNLACSELEHSLRHTGNAHTHYSPVLLCVCVCVCVCATVCT